MSVPARVRRDSASELLDYIATPAHRHAGYVVVEAASPRRRGRLGPGCVVPTELVNQWTVDVMGVESTIQLFAGALDSEAPWHWLRLEPTRLVAVAALS